MTDRLTSIAAHNWALFDGELASRGIDPLELPPVRFFSLVYYWAVGEASEEDKEKFDRRLFMPPAGVEPTVGPWTAEAETSAFQSFASQVKQK